MKAAAYKGFGRRLHGSPFMQNVKQFWVGLVQFPYFWEKGFLNLSPLNAILWNCNGHNHIKIRTKKKKLVDFFSTPFKSVSFLSS